MTHAHLAPTPGRPAQTRRVRVIPTLLIDRDGRLVKTLKFDKRTYIGDPINAMNIFNTKEVDELVLFDIDATRDGRPPAYNAIEDIVSEAFMPIAYGGGVRSMEQVERLYQCGIEKVVLSSCLEDGFDFIEQVATRYGNQAVVVCLQVKKPQFGDYQVRTRSGKGTLKMTPEMAARNAVARGAGEIIVYSIDRDGTCTGYDLALLARVAQSVDVPVVACGGAAGLGDFRAAVSDAGCAAVAAGSLFVFQSKTRGVLISYPSQAALRDQVFSKLD